jgi:hypothetical protein
MRPFEKDAILFGWFDNRRWRNRCSGHGSHQS